MLTLCSESFLVRVSRTTRRAHAVYECHCGTRSVKRVSHVKNGTTSSCGCEKGGKRRHSETGTRLYRIWNNMRNRCRNQNLPDYSNYGGRGISVCDRWQTYENFRDDMGYPEQNQTLDRIDVNGNYCPENCRWATRTEQCRNKRNNHFVSVGGETKTISEWCEANGLNVKTVHTRLRDGWDEARAVSEPVTRRGLR